MLKKLPLQWHCHKSAVASAGLAWGNLQRCALQDCKAHKVDQKYTQTRSAPRACT
jgi:hypothetical protein